MSLETPSSVPEATRVLRFLPKDISVLRVSSAREGPAATIDLVREVMQFAGDVAKARGVDPGRPLVADFGRRLYRAGATPSARDQEAALLAKKRRALFLRPRSHGDHLRTALRNFVERLAKALFSGLAIDYDGTLCARNRRFDPLEPDIRNELNRLLRSGIVLGVASGRGNSVYEQLRGALLPQYWNRVVVGFYNGAKVVELSERMQESALEIPDTLTAVSSVMRPLEDLLGFEMVVRPHQVSLRPRSGPGPLELRTVVIEQLAEINGISVVTSSHSVDVVLADTRKTTVVDVLRSKRPGCILRIGDQGAAGGNDFDLLNRGLSLSVDRVSSSLETCWNLGPPGLVGPTVTLQYLRALRRHDDAFRFDTSGLLLERRRQRYESRSR